MPTYADVEELKESAQYKAAGVIGRERLLEQYFPEEFAEYKAATKSHLMSVAYDPDDMEIEGGFDPDA